MKSKWYHSLRFKLIASVVIIEVVMLSIMVAHNVNSIYKTHTERLADTANSIMSQLAKTAGTYIFQVDYAALEDYTENIINHSEVQYIEIYNQLEERVVLQGTPPHTFPHRHPTIDAHPTKVDDGIYDVRKEIITAGRQQGVILMGFSLDTMNADIAVSRNKSIAIAVTEIVLSVIATILIGISFTKNLSRLTQASRQVETGDYTVNIDNAGNDEIGQVATAFNKMVQSIEKNTMEISAKQAFIKLLMDATAEAILGIDQNGNCRFANQACSKTLGYKSFQELIRRPIDQVLIPIGDTTQTTIPATDFMEELIAGIRQGTARHSDDIRLQRKDGSGFDAEYWSHPVFEGEQCVGAVITFLNISERKKAENQLARHHETLEQKVAQRTLALETANKELEAFAYSVSHDLRAPLRSIDGFSQILLEDYHNALDDDGKDYLRRVRKGAQLMGELINDLLQLSRTSRSKMELTMVDFSTICNDIGKQLQSSDDSRQLQLIIERDIFVQADAGLLRVLLTNLIENAWKFTRNVDKPRIEIFTRQHKFDQLFCIRDNGIGFDMEFAGKLFAPFQRLHSPKEYEGTGIGLATVKRVVQRHGGEIWVESSPNEGTTFFFTLPGFARFQRQAL